MPHLDTWEMPTVWTPETTVSELDEFITSSIWKDIQAVIKLQMEAFAQEALGLDLGMDKVYILRGRNAFAQLMLDFPQYMTRALSMEQQRKKQKEKERERKNE